MFCMPSNGIQLIENDGNLSKVYESILIPPEKLGVLHSKLSMKIIKELSNGNVSAIDIARSLKQHEQKIYYHMRKLENAGIIKQVDEEIRYGMTAKIYHLVSPIVSTKLYDNGRIVKNKLTGDPTTLEFLKPFIENGKLNALIIIGWPYPHGEFNHGGIDGSYAIDLGFLFGNMVSEIHFPCYKLDTKVKKDELEKNNIILIGNPKTNTIVNKINTDMDISFEKGENCSIISKVTGKKYNDDNVGMILKSKNPFNKNKEMILLGGKRSRGTLAAIIAFTQNTEEIMKGNAFNDKIKGKIFIALDKDSDEHIDSVKFLE